MKGKKVNLDADFSPVDSPSGFTCIFILHKNINAKRMVTLSAEELGTISKNNFLHPLLLTLNGLVYHEVLLNCSHCCTVVPQFQIQKE